MSSYKESAQDPDWLLTPEGLAATMGLIPEKEPPNLNEDIRAGLISHQVDIAYEKRGQ